jgi:hypothetical protein
MRNPPIPAQRPACGYSPSLINPSLSTAGSRSHDQKEASGVIANGYLRLDPQEWVRAVEKRRAALGR